MKTQLKLTHQVLKDLKQKAEALPPTPWIKNGKISYTAKTQKLSGADLLDKYPQESKEQAHKIMLTKNYVIKHRVPIMYNHYIQLQLFYKKHGEKGVLAYEQAINQFHKTNQENIDKVKSQITT